MQGNERNRNQIRKEKKNIDQNLFIRTQQFYEIKKQHGRVCHKYSNRIPIKDDASMGKSEYLEPRSTLIHVLYHSQTYAILIM